MSVTVYPASHPAREWNGHRQSKSANALLQDACPKEFAKSKQIIRSSFDDLADSNTVVSPSSNGFVYGVFKAYASHHHITIRPEDVWFAILTQLSFHVNANAEELRSFFVAHEGKKELLVEDVGTIHTADFGQMAVRMTNEMEKHIVDPDLRTWIMPNFTTTTDVDTVTAAVLMMGAMQKYFAYTFSLSCGIPSVTLLGEKDDWAKIRRRLDKLPSLGKEPERFARLLMPVLDYLVKTFDDPKDAEVVSFWNRICHHEDMGSGPTYLSGWITAFCFWDADGKRLYRRDLDKALVEYKEEGNFDSSVYHTVDTDDIPDAFISVPVKVDDNGTPYKTRMVAGSVGMQWSSSGQALDGTWGHSDRQTWTLVDGQMVENIWKPKVGEKRGLDSIQPVSGWWMYELAEDADGEEGKEDTAVPAKLNVEQEVLGAGIDPERETAEAYA